MDDAALDSVPPSPETVMPIRIAFLAPDTAIGERAMIIARELEITDSFSVYDGRLNVALEQARALEAAGVEVIVARGTTAEAILNSSVRTPVVEIPVSGQDLAKVLRDAKQMTCLPHPRIALLAFSSIQRDLEVFAGLLDINLDVYEVRGDINNIEKQVRRAKAGGADIIVAGSVSTRIAREYGIRSVQLDSGDVSLRTALHEAKKVAYARNLEKSQMQRFRAVMDTSRNGIIVVDNRGRILVANQEVHKILRLPFALGDKYISDILPGEELLKGLREGIAIQDELLTMADGNLLVSLTPTMVDDCLTGAVVILQRPSAIAELETKIRKSLYGKSMVSNYGFGDILGVSGQIRETLEIARRYAANKGTILIIGETGTGKELLAQAIHSESPCREGPFVAINCAALPPTLLESELFGYEEGAFTGARRKGKPGLFEMAHGGSIFLDEISEMDHYGQTRLLRVLQERCTMRLGGDKYIPVDVRVISATNRNLRDQVAAGKFREDLFYRLNVLKITLPPLRERTGDIRFLAQCLASGSREKFGRPVRLTDEALELLERHDWPGNVRELSTVIERLALTCEKDVPTEHELRRAMDVDLDVDIHQASGQNAERQRLLNALAKCNGNLQKAATMLGIHRSTLHRRMRACGLRREVTGR